MEIIMYKTINKYQMSFITRITVETAIVEEMVNKTDSDIRLTVVHIADDSYLVTNNLTKKYKLPENITLYRIQQLHSFAKLKKHNDAKTTDYKVLFMFDKTNGLWSEHVLYDKRHNHISNIYEMVTELPRGVIKSYIRTVPNNFSRYLANYVQWNPLASDNNRKYALALDTFNRAFDTTQTRSINKEIYKGR